MHNPTPPHENIPFLKRLSTNNFLPNILPFVGNRPLAKAQQAYTSIIS